MATKERGRRTSSLVRVWERLPVNTYCLKCTGCWLQCPQWYRTGLEQSSHFKSVKRIPSVAIHAPQSTDWYSCTQTACIKWPKIVAILSTTTPSPSIKFHSDSFLWCASWSLKVKTSWENDLFPGSQTSLVLLYFSSDELTSRSRRQT